MTGTPRTSWDRRGKGHTNRRLLAGTKTKQNMKTFKPRAPHVAPYDKSKRFVLRSGSFYIGNLDAATMENPLVTDRAQALVCDWRDNEVAKARFFSVLFNAPFAAEPI